MEDLNLILDFDSANLYHFYTSEMLSRPIRLREKAAC